MGAKGKSAQHEASAAAPQAGQLQAAASQGASASDFSHHGGSDACAQNGFHQAERLIIGGGAQLDQAGWIKAKRHQAWRVKIAAPGHPEQRRGTRQTGEQCGQKTCRCRGTFDIQAACGDLVQCRKPQATAESRIERTTIERHGVVRCRSALPRVKSWALVWEGRDRHRVNLFLFCSIMDSHSSCACQCDCAKSLPTMRGERAKKSLLFQIFILS